MLSKRPNLAAFLLVSVMASAPLAAAGCASQPASTDPDARQEVQNSPPPESETADAELPPGPPVKIDGSRQAEKSRGAAGKPGEESAREKGDAGATPGSQGPDDADRVSAKTVDWLVEQGPAYVLQQVRVSPAREEGDFVGFRLEKATEEALSALRPQMKLGDIITHINGIRVQKPDDYLSAWKQLPSASEIEIRYRREDNTQSAVWVVKGND